MQYCHVGHVWIVKRMFALAFRLKVSLISHMSLANLRLMASWYVYWHSVQGLGNGFIVLYILLMPCVYGSIWHTGVSMALLRPAMWQQVICCFGRVVAGAWGRAGLEGGSVILSKRSIFLSQSGGTLGGSLTLQEISMISSVEFPFFFLFLPFFSSSTLMSHVLWSSVCNLSSPHPPLPHQILQTSNCQNQKVPICWMSWFCYISVNRLFFCNSCALHN